MTAANLRGPHDLTSILGYGWQIYLRHFRTLFLLALVLAPIDLLTTITLREMATGPDQQLVAVWFWLGAGVISVVPRGAIIFAVHEIASGQTPGAGPSLDVGLQKFWTIFKTEFLAGILTGLSLLAAPLLGVYWLLRRDATINGRRDWYLALVPGLLACYLFVRWYFATNAVIVDRRRNWAALDSSADAVRGHWWRTLGIQIVITLVSFSPIFVASVSMYASPLADGLITAGVAALVLPYFTAAMTLLFYDLKARNRVEPDPAPIAASEPDLPREGP